MRKIYVAGAAAVAVLAVGGVASFYVAQRRATTEIETMFAALRTGGSTATHGAITFDIWSQALRVDDIVVKSTPEPGLDFKIAKLTADALEVSGNDIVSKTIVLSGVEANWKLAQPLDGQQALKLPRVTIKNFRVPKTIAMPPEATDALVRSVALFSATDASSVNAPSVTVSTSLTPPSTGVARAAAAPIAIDYTYSDVALENLHDGRIARAATSKIGIEGKSGFPILSGTIDSIKSADIDIAPMFGLGLGRRTMSDGFVRVQGKTEIGAYTVKTEAGVTVRVDAITGDDFAIDPSKLSYPRIMAMLPVFSAMGPNPTPSQTAKLADVLGTIYEGMRFKTLDVHGVRITDAKTKPALDFGIGRIGMRGFDKGKLAEFAVENAATENAPSPRGASPFRLGRFALLGFDLSALVRKSMSLAQPRRPGQPPQPADFVVQQCPGRSVNRRNRPKCWFFSQHSKASKSTICRSPMPAPAKPSKSRA